MPLGGPGPTRAVSGSTGVAEVGAQMEALPLHGRRRPAPPTPLPPPSPGAQPAPWPTFASSSIWPGPGRSAGGRGGGDGDRLAAQHCPPDACTCQGLPEPPPDLGHRTLEPRLGAWLSVSVWPAWDRPRSYLYNGMCSGGGLA